MPRYYNYAPGPGVGESAGEPSIGFNLTSKKVMYVSNVRTLQATLPEDITPLGSVPMACNADWVDVSFATTSLRSVDPILFTDQLTGRTFVSQLNTVTQSNPVLIGLNSLMAYTDDDGLNWTPAQINPPDGSNDHQTVGAGAYPVSLPLGNPVNKGSAVYYCGQGGYVLAVTSIAYCSRSDDGGLTFNKSVPAYNDVVNCSQAIHGHVKVAPDGTVYLPNAQCGGGQAVAVSTDAGTTWTVRTVPGSATPSGIIDPQVAVSKDPPVAPATSNTMYFAYAGPADGGNHMFVAATKDRGVTWSTPVDVGASLGINNVVFPAVVAGDSNRAAVGFLGTTTSGDHQAANFPGTWYGFVAHTYDGGQTWTTVNATPAGPVQRNACIWNGGGNNPCRNLLDFTDATIDDKGRVLFAFADGCVDECETGGPNSYSSKATIARQSGGKGVFAANDLAEPALAQRACLSGCRDDKASYLTWVPPDNGGSDISAYYIYRNTGGSDIFVGQAPGTATSFNDRGIDPTVLNYTYKIVAANALGAGPASNSITLPVGVCLRSGGACLAPGVTKVVDPAADETDGQPAHDITSISMSEPVTNAVTGAADNVVFTMKVASLSPVPPGFRWSIRFAVVKNGVLLTAPPSGIPQDTSASDYFLAMASDGSGANGNQNHFEWGVTSTPNGAARVFTVKGDLHLSSNVAADGTITLVMPKSTIQNPGPGDSIAITLASVRGALPSGTNETIFDSTGAGSYILRANNVCLPNTAPLAALTANVDHGSSPLTVNFNASASSDVDSIDTIGSYTFNFGDGGDDVTQPGPTITHTFNDPGQYIVRLVVTDSRGKQSSNTATFIVNVETPVSVFSRKIHGAAGPFDISLPVTGTPAIECRSGGANGDHQLIFLFANNLTSVGGASVTSGTGSVSSSMIDSSDSHAYIVNLTGVANAQKITVNLSNVLVSGGSNIASVPVTMSVLAADTTADGIVNSTDISQTKSKSGQVVGPSNFRNDVTFDGNLNSTDISLVKSKSGTGLP
jgi:PKD repeat protein